MNEHIRLLIDDIKKLWEKFDVNQKFLIAASFLIMVVVGVFFIAKATEPNWTVLYSDLSKDDVAAITESLKKSGHAYKLSEDRTSILVKNQDKEDLKMFIAENDLIKDSAGGFELLDDLQLGSTDFKNKLTKQRIFQGELTRSIEKIHGITKARVQLADPERSIFSDADENPSASVVLILQPGVKLKSSQILAIKNLVAYSIPRLTNDRVFITDQFGNVLSEDVSKNSSDMQTYRTNFEKEAAKKIQDTLETIMGKDNVSVQVSTVMDFNQTRATIESYTPSKETNAGVVMSQQGEKEIYSNPQPVQNTFDNQNKENSNPNNPNIVQAQQDAQNQLQEMNNQGVVQENTVLDMPLNKTPLKTVNYEDENAQGINGNDRKLSYEKEKSQTTYAVTKEVKQVVYAPGSVVRMSVAVAVNKILTDNEKEEIKNLVLAAAGMDVSRGDIVNVTSLKFTGIDNSLEEQIQKQEKQEFWMEVLGFVFKNVAPVFLILLLGLIALRSVNNLFKKQDENEEDEKEEELPAFDPYLALQQNKTNTDDFFKQEIQFASVTDKKKNDIINIILGNPEEAARILSTYIKE